MGTRCGREDWERPGKGGTLRRGYESCLQRQPKVAQIDLRPNLAVGPWRRPGLSDAGTPSLPLPEGCAETGKVLDRHRPALAPKFRTGTDQPGLQSSGQAPTGPGSEVQDRHRPDRAPEFRTGTNLSHPPEPFTAQKGLWNLGILGRLQPRARLPRVPVRSTAIRWIPCRIGPMTPGLSPLLLPPILAATSGTLHTCA